MKRKLMKKVLLWQSFGGVGMTVAHQTKDRGSTLCHDGLNLFDFFPLDFSAPLSYDWKGLNA